MFMRLMHERSQSPRQLTCSVCMLHMKFLFLTVVSLYQSHFIRTADFSLCSSREDLSSQCNAMVFFSTMMNDGHFFLWPNCMINGHKIS